MPQEDAREKAEYDEIRHEEATDPDSLYANNSFLQDIGSAAAGCETNSRGACAESRDNVLYSVAQLPKDQMKPTGQSQRNQSESAENDSFYDLRKLKNKKLTMLMPQKALWMKREPVQAGVTSELSGNNAELYSRIQELETNWNELNVSRAQWSINEYCKQGEVKQCRPCEKNWRYHEPSCYSFNDVGPTERLTWEEAREYCRALNADLFAAHNGREMQIIYKYSKGSYGIDGSWIGLRVENGKWKWADGSDLTDSSWVDPPTEGHCALSFWYRTPWSSVSCEEKQRWICQKKALSV
ncbi:hypothetical protein NQZ68_020091 [Dissostichus eleginoides]|nr:hypothetical protein NQZ68_020091 [Dissostichus eleginoides]